MWMSRKITQLIVLSTALARSLDSNLRVTENVSTEKILSPRIDNFLPALQNTITVCSRPTVSNQSAGVWGKNGSIDWNHHEIISLV